MCAEPVKTPPEGPGSDLVGQTLRNTYRILRVLDQGGMGMVFDAEHVRLRRRVAVKVLAQHLAGVGNALARFHREADIISRLQHPHIVQVVDYDTTEQGAPYIVMELLHGESLADRLDRERKLALPEAVRIALQVASGLSFANAAAIVHRDLKPANIFLVSVAGQPSYVKLLDFGISKHAAAAGLTGEFDVLGTPDYMAPEQARGFTASVDHRADQFSLAAITYEMLSGTLPFAGDDVASVLSRVINDEPPRLSTVAPSVPSAVEGVLKRALAKSPEQRYPHIADFATALAGASGCSMPPLGAKLASIPPPPPAGSPELEDLGPLSDAQARSHRAASTARTELDLRDSIPDIESEPERRSDPGQHRPITREERATPVLREERVTPARRREERVTPAKRRDPRVEPEAAARSSTPVPESRSRGVPIGRMGKSSVPPPADTAAKTPSAPPAPPKLRDAIDQARLAMGFGDMDLAIDYAESALRFAAQNDDEATRDAIYRAMTLFDLIFETRLGSLDRRVVVRKNPTGAGRGSLSPQQAFLLSRLEGRETLEEVVDLAPMPRREAIRLIVSLLRRGILEIE
jgi:serine/threonine protein kinase